MDSRREASEDLQRWRNMERRPGTSRRIRRWCRLPASPKPFIPAPALMEANVRRDVAGLSQCGERQKNAGHLPYSPGLRAEADGMNPGRSKGGRWRFLAGKKLGFQLRQTAEIFVRTTNRSRRRSAEKIPPAMQNHRPNVRCAHQRRLRRMQPLPMCFNTNFAGGFSAGEGTLLQGLCLQGVCRQDHHSQLADESVEFWLKIAV